MRRRRILVGLAAAILALWVAATLRIVFFPTEDVPGRADAVVVLSGSKHERLDRALELMAKGVAPTLVISGGLDPRQPRAVRLCRAGELDRARVLCFMPHPDSTRGEARTVAELARRYGWKRILLVTSTFHVTRARMLFDRCLAGDVDAVGAPYPWTSAPAAVIGEWFKTLRALTWQRGC
jgi:uncharacterized SAM-binding protein YcdF (DUF218 family)